MSLAPQKISAHKVTAAVCGIDRLALAQFELGQCLKSIAKDDVLSVETILENSVGLAFLVVKLGMQNGISLEQNNYSLAEVFGKLDKKQFLACLLNAEVSGVYNSQIREFLRFNIARVAAAKLIVETSSKGDKNRCCLTGLFCGLSRVVLAQLYPKSMELIIQEAQKEKSSIIDIQNRHFGTNEIILGKRLAEKWCLGDVITEAIWLQNADQDSISASAVDVETVNIVRLAGGLARQAGVGHCGEFDEFTKITSSQTSDLLANNLQIDRICKDVEQIGGDIAEVLGLESNEPASLYQAGVKDIALAGLGQSGIDAERLGYLKFVEKFSNCLSPTFSLLDVEKLFCETFCEVFGFSKMCIYSASEAGILEAFAISDKVSKSFILEPVEEFDLSGADLSALTPWLFEQIDVDFQLSRTRFYRLTCGSKVIGGFFYEAEVAEAGLDDSTAESIGVFGGKFLFGVLTAERSKFLSEKLLDRLARLKKAFPAVEEVKPEPEELPGQYAPPAETPIATEPGELFESIAELSAGAAHELNNPLSVISGRIQLLLESETDDMKKIAFKQICEKVKDVEEIVGELMEFGRPAPAETRPVSPLILINQSLEKVRQRYGEEPLDIIIEGIETLSDVQVDPSQLSRAFAEVIFNSLESYESGNGPTVISASESDQSDKVEITISDSGCGMSRDTLSKALCPFYSDKPAGRQRGMGLTIAKRLLCNSNCSMEIDSHADEGTVVTIQLPKSVV